MKIAVAVVIVLLAMLNALVIAQQQLDDNLETQGWESLGFFLDGRVVSQLKEKNEMTRRTSQILNILTRKPNISRKRRHYGRKLGEGPFKRGYMSPKRSDSFMKRIREEYNRKNKSGPRAGQRGYISPKRSDSFMKRIREEYRRKNPAIRPVFDNVDRVTIGGKPSSRIPRTSPVRSNDHMRRIREGRTSSQHYQHLMKPAVINRTKPYLIGTTRESNEKVRFPRMSPVRSDDFMRRIRGGRTNPAVINRTKPYLIKPGWRSPVRSDNHIRRIREGRTSSQHYQHLMKPAVISIRDFVRNAPQPITTKPYLVRPTSPVRSDNFIRTITQHSTKPAVVSNMRFRR